MPYIGAVSKIIGTKYFKNEKYDRVNKRRK